MSLSKILKDLAKPEIQNLMSNFTNTKYENLSVVKSYFEMVPKAIKIKEMNFHVVDGFGSSGAQAFTNFSNLR